MKDAEIELGPITLRLEDWNLNELARTPQGFSTDMQLSGWIPAGLVFPSGLAGEALLTRAVLDTGYCRMEISGAQVLVEVKGYGEPRKFIKIRWPHHDAEGED